MAVLENNRTILPNGVESIITVSDEDASGYATTYIFTDEAGLKVSLPVSFGRLEDAKMGLHKLTENELMELHVAIVQMVTDIHNDKFEESLDKGFGSTKIGETK